MDIAKSRLRSVIADDMVRRWFLAPNFAAPFHALLVELCACTFEPLVNR
jgi:hypothetical protein